MTLFTIPITLVLFASSFSQILSQDASEGQCVMYGQCGEGDYGSLNCVYNGKAKPVEDQDAISMLKQICPEYVDGDKAVTCCDPQQIEAMEGNFKLPERLLGKCPSCFYNFRKTFCKLTCSPNQSQYMKVTGTQKSDEGKDMVTDLIYYVAESFSNGLFNSCKSVEGIIPGTRVIDLMCGGWGSKCNGERWLRFMGSTPENQGFSPVQINYTFTSEPKVEEHSQIFYPMAENTHKCNVSPAQDVKACDCSNCPDSCPKTSTTTTTTAASTTTTPLSSTTVETSSVLSYSEASKDTETIAPDGDSEGISIARDSRSNPTSGAAESRPKLLNNKLFRRILSPLIVIAPAFADD